MRALSHLCCLWLSAGIAACHRATPGDYGATPPATTPDREDTGEVPVDDTADTTDTGPPGELCNGLDDDGDGEVDEGFADSDLDGAADCVDDTCEVSGATASEAVASEACDVEVAPSTDPWNVEILWEWDSTETQCRVGAVADIDGDGVAEIPCSPGLGGDSVTTWVLDGATGSVDWTTAVWAAETPLVAVDLERDGAIELVGIGTAGLFLAMDGAGTTVWRGLDDLGSTLGTGGTEWIRASLAIGDVGADGVPDVIGHHGVVRTSDGVTTVTLDTARYETVIRMPRELGIDDLDLDDSVDILDLGTRLDLFGRVEWEVPELGDRYAVPAPVQADGDDEAEVLWVSDSTVVLVEHDGTELSRWDPRAEGESLLLALPCIADLDGDGDSELFIADGNGDVAQAHELTGELLWSIDLNDPSDGALGCTTFDFDLDGASEVLTSDGASFYILDGTTGEILYEDTTWRSGTYWESPLVVDLDGDGSVEIVLPNGWTGDEGVPLRVYGNVNRDWPPGSTIWPHETWSGTSHYADGRIPRTPEPSWLKYNAWRAQPTALPHGTDLSLELVDSCFSSCELDDAEVHLALRLVNGGPEEVEHDLPLAVYGFDGDGARTLLTTLTVGDLVGDPAGFLDNEAASPSYDLVLTTARARHGVEVVAGDDGTGAFALEECSAEDNSLTWAMSGCEE